MEMIDWLKEKRNLYSKKLIKIADTQSPDFIYISGRLMMLDEVIDKVKFDSLDAEKELMNYPHTERHFDKVAIEIAKKFDEMNKNLERGEVSHIFNIKTNEWEEVK